MERGETLESGRFCELCLAVHFHHYTYCNYVLAETLGFQKSYDECEMLLF